MIYSEKFPDFDFDSLGAVNLEPVPGSHDLLDEVAEQCEKLFSDYCERVWILSRILENEIHMTKAQERELRMKTIWCEGDDDWMDNQIYHYEELCAVQERLLALLQEYTITRTYILSVPGAGWRWKFRHIL